MKSATIEGTAVGDQQFYGCKNLKSIVLSNNVTSIGNNSFIGCTSLTSVIIPQSVSSIGSAAFNGCYNLLLVVSENENPINIDAAVFYGISSNARLQVPVGTKSKYQAITGWGLNFKEIVDDGYTPEVLTLTIQVDGLGVVNYDGVSLRNKVSSFYILEGRSATLSFNADNTNGLKIVKENNVDVTSNIANNQYTTNAITSNSIIEAKFEHPELTEGQTFSEGYSYGSITYRVISVNDKTCEVYLAYSDEDDGDFIIPASIYGYRVIGINNYAFGEETDMESITIPPTITYIGKGAFDDGGTVSDVYISDLEAWCNISFADIYSAPSNANLWLNGEKITDLIIPNSITKINDFAFDGCSCIRSVYIHEGVNEIGERAFAGCRLSSVTMMATTPATIDATSFPSRKSAMLYVPHGCKAVYEAADYWKEFKEIVELAAPAAPGHLYVEDTSVRCGSEAVIPVLFESEAEYGGLQCEVTLPAGITLSKLSKTDRLSDDFVLQKSKTGDNTWQILLYNTNRLSFSGNDGALFTMTVDVDDDMAEGDYTMTFSNIVASGVDESQDDLADYSTTIRVEKYLTGDANRDGRVNVTDIMAVANHILKQTGSNFNEKATDVNGDRRVNVTDIMGIANIILKVNTEQNAPARALTLDPQ